MSTGLSARIYNKIRAAIIEEAYPVGSKLPAERELADHFGAGRFAVREAVAMLSQDGFVETLPQSGTYVKDFYRDGSLDTLVQTLRIRRVIERQTLVSLLKYRVAVETEAAAAAALRAAPEDIAYLKANLERKAGNLADLAVLTECDYDFHFKVISLSGNIVSRLVFQSFKPIYSFFTEFFYSLPGAPQASLTLNRSLVSALQRGDRDGAFEAMKAILQYSENKIFEVIDDRAQLIVLRRVDGGE